MNMEPLFRVDALDPATASYQVGEAAYRRGRAMLLSQREDGLSYLVHAPDEQTVVLPTQGAPRCGCGSERADGAPCAHIVAALWQAQADGTLPSLTRARSLWLGQEMLLALGNAMPSGESVHLLPTLRWTARDGLAFGLSMGQGRLLAVRSIPELLRCHAEGEPMPMGAQFTYQPRWMRLTRDDDALLALLASHIAPGDAEAPAVKRDGRMLLPTGAFLQSLLRFLETRPFALTTGGQSKPQQGIRTVDLPLCFTLSLSPTELSVTAAGAETLRPVTEDGRYALCEGRLVRLHSAQARVCRLLAREGSSFSYPARDAEGVLCVLLPALSAVGTVAPEASLSQRLLTAPFEPKAYLDAEDGAISARLEFWYGEQRILPFAAPDEPDAAKQKPLILRDGRAEGKLMDFLSNAGFVVHGGRVTLRRARDVLAFCTQGVAELGKMCEVYVSPAFERVRPRRFTGRAAFRMKGGRLVFSLLDEQGESPELLPVLRAIAERQSYVRLRTGEFLDVRDMVALAPVAQELLDAARLDEPTLDEDARELHLGAYRAQYMVSMLRLAGADVDAEGEVEGAITSLKRAAEEAESYVPARLQRKLQLYQRRGAGWLLSLYEARMGGILADEMGLGKTVQVIAALSAAKRRDGAMMSLIVTPTSLIYHWLAEFKRFDDTLRPRLIAGPREERERVIEEIRHSRDVDVILTSYPLLRRDIPLLRDIPLRFAILDEAQFVKNAQSLGAVAAKELSAQARVGLSGTPMENHTGELWSLFDFVLPGYLGTLSAFLRRYGGGERSEELQQRIRPFLMRRLKKDVLSDLPGKHEQSLYAAMTPEQSLVYRQLLQSLRQHVGAALEQGALPRARMQILGMLLKLRQACCHPRLLLPDYEGGSGKLELLIQLVRQAVASKRRMLVFSQFVGMLQIIRKRLAREGLKPLYLDGDTKPEQRQALCDRFNGGEGSVFLVSLKAGGTGLNLTGADLVIHFDPWWNPAAEDQATDRAHRIGQTRDVDVVRLITQDSIEEKVTEMGKRKRALFDRVVLAGETELSSLSEEDIRKLFF